MPVLLIAQTADEVWLKAARLFDANGAARPHSGRGGDTLEVLRAVLTVENPSNRWVVSRQPAMNPAFALVEAFWIVSGRGDSALPLHWNPRLAEFCGDDAHYHGAYGHRLRSHFGIDQLDRVYQALLSAPATRQAALQIWDARCDLPDEEGNAVSRDIPCNVIALPKVREGRLEWTQILRSNDLFLGVPHNIVQFTALQEMLAGWLGIQAGQYVQIADSLHVYSRDLEMVRRSTIPVPLPPASESFALDRTSWDRVIPAAMRRLDGMTDPALAERSLRSLALVGDLPEAYEDVIRIAAADTARRKGWAAPLDEVLDGVRSRCLLALWERWMVRTRQGNERSSSGA